MKQLLFLLLFPCFALAQYPGNANQKITLGEQTTADGLVFRGVASIDTVTATSKITRANKQDTSAFLLLDTVTNLLWHYKTASNGWIQAGGSTLDTATMLLPYYRSGRALGTPLSGVLTNATGLPISTGLTGLGAANRIPYASSTTELTTSSGLTFDGTNFATTGTATATRFNPTANTATGTGMYLPASNTLGFSTNNTERMRITSDGNVGIGTSSPTNSRLLVAGTHVSGYSILGVVPVGNQNATIGVYNSLGVRKGLFTSNTGFVRVESDADPIQIYAGGVNGINVTTGSNVGIGQTTPTAALHLKAGTASANTAPLKFTSGTLMDAAEAGAMEFNGTNLFFSPSTTRHTVNHGLPGSATLDFPSTTTLLSADLTITVTGASAGDVVSLGVPNAAVNANTCYTAWVSATNTVTVRFNNYSSGTVDPASGTFKVFVTK